mmetsp:Transcript_25235/g.58582  ORF Transcript_25235/g.58582 Transcript_25235/m.58582 type:complete len:759 (-) Transcript_25235:138-2414(-)
METTISSTKSDASAIDDRMKQIETAILSVKSDASQMEMAITSVKSDASQMEAVITSMRSDASSLREQQQNFEAQQWRVWGPIWQQAADGSRETSSNADVAGELGRLESKSKEMEMAISFLKSDVSALLNQQQSWTGNLQEMVSSHVNADMREQQALMLTLKKDLDAVQVLVQDLARDRQDNPMREALALVQQATSRSTDLAGEIVRLDAKMKEMDSSITSVKSDAAALTTQQQTLNASLQAATAAKAVASVDSLPKTSTPEHNSARSSSMSPRREYSRSSIDPALIEAALGRERATQAARGDLPSQLRSEFATRVEAVDARLRTEMAQRIQLITDDIRAELNVRLGSLDVELRCEIASRIKLVEGELQQFLQMKMVANRGQPHTAAAAAAGGSAADSESEQHSDAANAGALMLSGPVPGGAALAGRSVAASLSIPCLTRNSMGAGAGGMSRQASPGPVRSAACTPKLNARAVSPAGARPSAAAAAAAAAGPRHPSTSSTSAEKTWVEQQLEGMRRRTDEASRAARRSLEESQSERAVADGVPNDDAGRLGREGVDAQGAPFFSDELKDSLVKLASKVNTALKVGQDGQSNASSGASVRAPSQGGGTASNMQMLDRPQGTDPPMVPARGAGPPPAASWVPGAAQIYDRSRMGVDASATATAREGSSPVRLSSAAFGSGGATTPSARAGTAATVAARPGVSGSRAATPSSTASPSLRSARFGASAATTPTASAGAPTRAGPPSARQTLPMYPIRGQPTSR